MHPETMRQVASSSSGVHLSVALAVILLGGMVGCGSSSSSTIQQQASDEPAFSEREPFTTHYRIAAEGEIVGYLVAYDSIPFHAQGTISRSLPSGSSRILGMDWQDTGYITPTGEVRRHVYQGASAAIGVRTRVEDGLSLFFDGARPIELLPFADQVSGEVN